MEGISKSQLFYLDTKHTKKNNLDLFHDVIFFRF